MLINKCLNELPLNPSDDFGGNYRIDNNIINSFLNFNWNNPVNNLI